jgi:hypothetical protein
MAVGIKKIIESVIEDGRALTYCFSSDDGKEFPTVDNSAIDQGAIFSSYGANGCFIRIKRGNDVYEKLHAVKTLVPQTVETSLIKDLNVTEAKIAKDAVTTVKIKDKAVVTAKLGDSAVTTVKLANQCVTNAKIAGSTNDSEDANRAITHDKIRNANIITSKIKDQNVTTAKIKDAAITTIKIKDASVTTPKIANSAITTPKIANESVVTDKLANNAVVTLKIADQAVTWSKLHNEVVSYIKEEIARMIRESEERMKQYIQEVTKHMLRHDGNGNVTGANGSSSIKQLKILEDFNCRNINAIDTIEGRRVYNMTYK